jgi:hypothetical protein
VRNLNINTEDDEPSPPGRSTLRIDLADDGLDATKDPTVTTLVDTLADDLASGIPTTVTGDFSNNVRASPFL